VGALTAGLLAPFTGKAFHIDDPLFLWGAEQILRDPVRFFGVDVNWYGTPRLLATVFNHPPLASFLIAALSTVAGWGERALHVPYLAPALAAAWGTWALGRGLGGRPVVAALATVLTPAFLTSATNLMCDVMLVAWWVWAVALWVRGLALGRAPLLWISALLQTAAVLTKYSGINLVLLLLAYSLVAVRRPGRWLAPLAVPVAAICLYQWGTHELYGTALLSDAAGWSIEKRWVEARVSFLAKPLATLAFVGGGMVTGLLYAPILRVRWLLAAILPLALGAVWLAPAAWLGVPPAAADGPLLRLQLGTMIAGGAVTLALAADDIARRRDPTAFLLAAWLGGVFAFAAFVNWTINIRSLLPAAPAVGILVARGLVDAGVRSRIRLIAPLVPAAALAVVVCWSDHVWANSARDAALRIGARVGGSTAVWFQGHWGFQYYMERLGARPVHIGRTRFAPGDLLVVPTRNTNVLFPPPGGPLVREEVIEAPTVPWIATHDAGLGAGFYSDNWGPMPYAFGSATPSRYHVFRRRARSGFEGKLR
jgi:hypothetical protein